MVAGIQRQGVCCLVAVLLCSLLTVTGFAATGGKLPRVFIVHSYDPDNFCSSPQDRGLVEGLADRGFVDGETVEIKRFYMDTKRIFTTSEQIESRGREALDRIREYGPDVVITADDNAVRTVMLPLVGGDIPVVFTGINNRPEVYNQGRRFMYNRQRPGHNVTGVHEKLYIAKNMQVMKEVIPGLQKIVFIVDVTITGNAVKKQMEEELFADNSGILYTIRSVSSFEEYKQLIRRMDADPEVGAYYPVALRLTTGDGGVIAGRDIIHWTLGHTRKPALAANYFMCKLGMFGGVSVDFVAMGRQAAHKAARILSGTPAGEIAVEDSVEYALIFNIARVRQLGMTIPQELLQAADTVFETMELTITPKPFHILLAQAENRTRGSVTEIERGLLAELAGNGFVEGENLKISRRFFPATSFPGREAEQQPALQELTRLNPDLVVTLDDVAATAVMLPLVNSSYPVLFGGITVPPERYDDIHDFMVDRSQPGKNVSGVSAEYQFEKTLEFARLAFPEAENVILIKPGGTYWPAGLEQTFAAQVAACEKRCGFASIRIVTADTLKALQQMVLAYNDDPEVDLVSIVSPEAMTDEDGTAAPLAETLDWLAANQKKPEFAFTESRVRHGCLMAVAVDLQAAGTRLGKQVVRVLQGADPGDLAIQGPEEPLIVVNQARARQLAIDLPVNVLEAAHRVYHVTEPAQAR